MAKKSSSHEQKGQKPKGSLKKEGNDNEEGNNE